MNFLGLSGLINFLTCISIAVFVLLKNRKNPLNISFFNLNFSVALYSFGYFLWQLSRNENDAMFWFKILVVGIILINITYLYFVFRFLGLIDQKRNLLRICTAINFIFIILNLSSILYSRVEPRFNLGFWPVPTVFFHIYLLFWFWQCLYGFYWLLKGLQLHTGIEREQIKYFTISAILGFVGGATNWPTWYGFYFPPYLNITISLYIGIMVYAIFRFRLLDINVVLTRAWIFLIVYLLVLGIPLGITGWGKDWLQGLLGTSWYWAPVILAIVLATLGPIIYTLLRRQAESRILSEEHRAQQVLTQAAGGMMRYRSIKRLLDLIVHVTCKTLKLDNAGMYLVDEQTGNFKLETMRIKGEYSCPDSLSANDPLVQRLNMLEEPLVYEEVRIQSQQLKDSPEDSIHEIERQMCSLFAAVIVPATSRERLLGFLILGKKKSGRMYSKDDLSVLWALSYQAALAIENARFHEKAEEELLKGEREFTASYIGHGASHQFKNLLNKIMQHSRLKEMELDELDLNNLNCDDLKNVIAGLKKELQGISEKVTQGNEIVSGILSIGSGSPVDFKQSDLSAIIQRAVQTVKLKMSKHLAQSLTSIPEITVDVPENLPKVWCNSLQIEQVMDNFLDNDLEAIEEKEVLINWGRLNQDGPYRGKIHLQAWSNNEHISLKVSDNGIGIKPEDQKKIFLPFFTTKATGRISRKGHGIGMHVIKKVIEAHQGKVYLQTSEYGKGSSFIIEFPLEVKGNKAI